MKMALLRQILTKVNKLAITSGYRLKVGNHEATKFKAPKSACTNCDLRSQCLRYPDRTEIRQVAYFHARSPKSPETNINRMKRKIDTAVGQMIYSKRIATAEPPFAQIRHILGLDRFSFREKKKVNCQWLLFCVVYNMKRFYNCDQVATT